MPLFRRSRNDFLIVFNEIWQDAEVWSAHGRWAQIQQFFQCHVQADDGLVESVQVTACTDEAQDYDAPVFE